MHSTLRLTLTLTPLGREDLSIEPGRGIGGVHLGDTLDALRRLYPHAASVRKLASRPGRTLWLVGVRGGMQTGLQAIVGVAGRGGAKAPGSATVREVETTFATPSGSDRGYRTAGGIGAGSTFASLRRSLPRGRVVAWTRAVDGRVLGSWYVAGAGRAVSEFDFGQIGRAGQIAGRQRGISGAGGLPRHEPSAPGRRPPGSRRLLTGRLASRTARLRSAGSRPDPGAPRRWRSRPARRPPRPSCRRRG